MSEAEQQGMIADSSIPRDTVLSPNESLAMALINTETLYRGARRDELSSPNALAHWWARVCERFPDQCHIAGAQEPIGWTNELLDAVRALRRTVRTLINQVVEWHSVQDEQLKPLNEILALGYTMLEATAQGHVNTVMRLRDPEQGNILLPIALSAMRLLTESDWERLHQCKSDRCIVFFYDTTKSGTRRWCSPGCMNRARSLRHYHETKSGG